MWTYIYPDNKYLNGRLTPLAMSLVNHILLAFANIKDFTVCTKLQTSAWVTCALSSYGCLPSTWRKLYHLELTWEFYDSGNSSNALGQQIHMPLSGTILSRFVFFICENNVWCSENYWNNDWTTEYHYRLVDFFFTFYSMQQEFLEPSIQLTWTQGLLIPPPLREMPWRHFGTRCTHNNISWSASHPPKDGDRHLYTSQTEVKSYSNRDYSPPMEKNICL